MSFSIVRTTPDSLAAWVTAEPTLRMPPTAAYAHRPGGALRVGLGVALMGVALVLLAHLAYGVIERRVHDAVRASLDHAGYGWVTLAVSGQTVQLGGVEPRPGVGHQALRQARDVTCPTWTGPRPCATQVVAAFSVDRPARP